MGPNEATWGEAGPSIEEVAAVISVIKEISTDYQDFYRAVTSELQGVSDHFELETLITAPNTITLSKAHRIAIQKAILNILFKMFFKPCRLKDPRSR